MQLRLTKRHSLSSGTIVSSLRQLLPADPNQESFETRGTGTLLESAHSDKVPRGSDMLRIHSVQQRAMKDYE